MEGNSLITSIATAGAAIIGVAFLAILLSRNSQTAQVITAGGQAFSQDLGAALAPVTQASGLSAVL